MNVKFSQSNIKLKSLSSGSDLLGSWSLGGLLGGWPLDGLGGLLGSSLLGSWSLGGLLDSWGSSLGGGGFLGSYLKIIKIKINN